ncbi:MAG TPA: aminoglycoside phosphotransferase family protein [Nocardioidaceae bacterium]|nr:aminoglycoside phosphotransferase family protein [Nocardioidaceae bacterium]
MSVVPEFFADMIEIREGDAGETWIADLPGQVDRLLAEWRLRVDGETRFGYVGIVVPVRCADETPAALKVSYPDEESASEVPALAAWDADGVVRLLRHDESGFAILLEWLDPDRSLFAVPVDDGVQVLGELMARLHRRTAPSGVPRLADESRRWLETVPRDWEAHCTGHDRRLLDAALATWHELGPEAGDTLLHRDLHYGNVLAGTREPWLAIDPKGMAGDPAYDVIPAVWNRLELLLAADDPHAAVRRRVDQLCEVAGIDRARAYPWTLARAVEDLTWQRRTGSSGPGGEILIAEAMLD